MVRRTRSRIVGYLETRKVMEENIILRLNDTERAILKGECKLGNTFFWIGVMAAVFFAIFVLLLAHNVAVAVISAVVLMLIGLLVRRSLNKDFTADLDDDQKMVVVKPLDRLEMNPQVNPDVASSTAFNYRLSKLHAGLLCLLGQDDVSRRQSHL